MKEVVTRPGSIGIIMAFKIKDKILLLQSQEPMKPRTTNNEKKKRWIEIYNRFLMKGTLDPLPTNW